MPHASVNAGGAVPTGEQFRGNFRPQTTAGNVASNLGRYGKWGGRLMKSVTPMGIAGMGLAMGGDALARSTGSYGTRTGKALHYLSNIGGTALSTMPILAGFGPAGIAAGLALGAGYGLYSQYQQNKQNKEGIDAQTAGYKQTMIQRLQGKDLDYYNSLNESQQKVYLSSPDIQKRLLGNTINDANNKALAGKNTGVQEFTPEQIEQRRNGYY
jgi:hypothetical protein